MARDQESRHWKSATADICGSAAGLIQIFSTRRLVVPETNRANRATQPDPKVFPSSLRFHHGRLRTLSILDGNGGPQTADLDLVYLKKLSDRAFHLELDQSFQFDRIFHRKLADEV